MIVDFPEVKTRLYKNLLAYTGRQMKSAFPLMDLVGVKRQHEGKVLDYNTMDGQQKQMQYLEHSFQTVFQGDEFETLTIPDIFERFRVGAMQMAASIAQTARETITTATEEVGNVLKNGDMTDPENILTMLETVQVDFNGSREHPKMPTLWADPQSIEGLQRRFAAMSDEERQDYLRRREEILDRKYAEYVSRENDRKLVD